MQYDLYIKKYSLLMDFIMTVLVIGLVDYFKVPNPNVVLLTVIVYLTFRDGYSAGFLSGLLVIVYSLYFFSQPQHLGSFTDENLKKVIVIIIFVPIMVFIVGGLKRQYVLKAKELEIANQELHRVARTDMLTGIPNRRYFDETYATEYRRARRAKYPTSLLMIDIDFFKKFNDYYGHVSGDHCLTRVAQAIHSSIQRPTDFVARYGGEEFIVLLSNTDSKGAMQIANRIIHAVDELNIVHCSSETCSKITVSVGVATIADFDTISQDILLENADKALYHAKQNGRHQAVYYNGEG